MFIIIPDLRNKTIFVIFDIITKVSINSDLEALSIFTWKSQTRWG